jgi:hypothetical protein
MTLFTQLERWEQEGVISSQQRALLGGLARGEPFSLYLELNALLYVGVIAFIGGLAWTVTEYSRELGALAIIGVLSAILAGSLIYCFAKAAPFSARETESPNLVFDYVLYLGSLAWSVELAYIENHFHLMSGQWDDYLLATSCFFFVLAYRFDNRLVLSLALSALAGWFGLTISRWPATRDETYRTYAILYSFVVSGTGLALRRLDMKAHFEAAYLNVAANVLFIAVLSGVFLHTGYALWLVFLIALSAASLAHGLAHRRFSFVAYAAIYGYIGVSSVLVRNITGEEPVLAYFIVTGAGMLIALWQISRRFGRDA